MSERAYDPDTGYTSIVTADGEEVLAYGRHEHERVGRETPRRRKDRHVPRGRLAASSSVETTSALASDGVLMMTAADRRERRKRDAEERRARGCRLPVERDAAFDLLALRRTLPPA